MNRKFTLLFIALFLINFGVHSQNSEKGPYASILEDESTLYDIYTELLDREFTKILTSQNTNFGTFGSISTTDDIVTLNGHFRVNKSNNIGVNLKGGTADGIVSILQGENVSSNLSLGIQYNLGIYSLKDTVYADATKMRSFFKTYDSLKTANKKQKKILEYSYEALKLKRDNILFQIKTKTKKINALPDPNTIRDDIKKDSLSIIINTLNYEIKILTAEDSALQKELATINEDWVSVQKQIADQQMISKFKEAFKKLNLTGFDIKWWSFSVIVNNTSFKLFNQAHPFDDQIIKERYNEFDFGVAYNRYQIKPGALTFYHSIGLNFTINDNFNDLIKKTIKDQQQVSSFPNQRIVENTTTAYTGEYKTGILGLELDYNHYHFLNRSQTFALHFNPKIKSALTDFYVDFDAEVGGLLAFKNKEDKSIINAELFYRLEDIRKIDQDDDDEGIVNHSQVGLRLIFPVQFVQNL